MESSLNLAHQQGRKADQLLKVGKYDEAISCHNRAADYVLNAMQQTQCAGARDSLKLQHAHHLKQTDQLYDRQRRAQILQIKRTQAHLCNQSTQTNIQGPVIKVSMDQPDPHTPYTPQGDSRPAGTETVLSSSPPSEEDDPNYCTITEQGSLIGYLLRRQQTSGLDGDENYTNFHSGVPVERKFHNRRAITSLADDMKQDMENEELRSLNEDLRSHVKQLLKEVEVVRDENAHLRERLDGRQMPSFCDSTGQIEMLPELPPLDMPTFDVDFNFQEYGKKLSGLSYEDADSSFEKTDILGAGSKSPF